MKILRAFLVLIGLLALGETADLAWLSHVRATIISSISSIVVSGNGSQTVFSFPFIGVSPSDVTVVYIDASGNQTTLTQNTQYSISLNAPVTGSIWGIGGSITYPLVGSPISAGTTLLISRSLPLEQTVSSNNGNSFSLAVETALDLLEMQIQQISNFSSQVLTGNAADPSGLNYAAPPVAQRANMAMGWDGNGNVIAFSTAPSGAISSAMQPVVSASTLSAGRAAFGLGSAATGSVNCGLQQGVSASGNIDVNFTTVQDATNQTVSASFCDTQRIATGPITYTLPRANTLWNGFGFWVYAASGLITITPNANDNFLGLAAGTGIAVPPGSWVFITTNAASSGVWWADYHGPTNADLACNANSGALSCVFYSGPLQFRDTTLTAGDPVWSLPASGISLTIPSTATLGTTNNTPFRVWWFVAYNSGTPVLGVATCSVPTQIYGCKAWPSQQITASAISTGSNSSGTLYTSSSITTDSVIFVAYSDFCITASCTAGTWVAPSTIQLCLAPRQCPMPGDVVKGPIVAESTSTAQSTSATKVEANPAISFTPLSAPDLIHIHVDGNIGIPDNTNGACQALLSRGSSFIALTTGTEVSAHDGTATANRNGDTVFPLSLNGLDAPGSVSAITYVPFIFSGGSFDCNWNDTAGSGAPASFIEVYEIMGALVEPSNDNATRKAA